MAIDGVHITNINKPIVFISDLHFDYTQRKHTPKYATKTKNEFVAYVKKQYSNCILCLAGDFYDDHRKTLAFAKELERKRITGFFVLGNHDFWNDGTKSHEEVLKIFEVETEKNSYFKFLTTGRKYYFDGICIIGDTGWTSFRTGKRKVALNQFMHFPDARLVKNFNPKQIIAMHNRWVAFANNVLADEPSVLIVTHFPMIDFTKKDRDCWWSSQTNLKGENSWRIFGHTHRRNKLQQHNNVTSQRGYDNKGPEYLMRSGDEQYSSDDFGRLEKSFDPHALALSSSEIILKFYTPRLVSNPRTNSALVNSITRRGFMRCSANKRNFACLANTPNKYLDTVKKIISGYAKGTFIGYTYANRISNEALESIYAAIAVLESPDRSDMRRFITAAIITGYAFNHMPDIVDGMRPLDDYDIMRFWLMLMTMKRYGITMQSIHSIKKHDKNRITFGNVDLYLPAVNNRTLAIEDVEKLLQQMPLLLKPAL